MNNTNKLTEDAKKIIESLFEYDVKHTKTKSASLQFVGKKLNGKEGHEEDYRVMFYTHFIKFYKKHSRVFTHEDFVSEYAVAITQSCAALGDRFPDFETFKNDHKVQMETMKYIKITAEALLYKSANPTAIKTKVKDKNVGVKTMETSLEAIQDAYKENEGEFELDNSNILFGTNIEEDAFYEFNDVVKTFLESKNKVLTAKQLVFYNKMKDLYVDNNNGHITKKQMLKEVGLTQNQYYKYLKNIEKRANQYYSDYGQNKSMSEDSRKGLLRALNNYVKVVEDKAGVNIFKLNASRIVQDNYEDEAFEIIILKGLSIKEKQHVVRTVKGQHYLTTKVIHKIYKNIKDYLRDNKLQHVKPSEVKGGYTESLLTDEQKKNPSSFYVMDAKGVAHAQDYSDITESEVV